MGSATFSEQRWAALSRWENEGGALTTEDAARESPDLTNTELVQLRVRVIALENLVIALLAGGSPAQRALVRDMAAYILPRPGHTMHPLTVHAGHQMLHLVDRSDYFSALVGVPSRGTR